MLFIIVVHDKIRLHNTKTKGLRKAEKSHQIRNKITFSILPKATFKFLTSTLREWKIHSLILVNENRKLRFGLLH